ncbi:hypothetical protein V5T82_15585 [Magnetovibrio sp. PR-2]|uniref:hypothetical protein n=1 Tax=Magnetovibrio sp. PR-2 TaxID=3120356 RepID=UPI002FCE002B
MNNPNTSASRFKRLLRVIGYRLRRRVKHVFSPISQATSYRLADLWHKVNWGQYYLKVWHARNSGQLALTLFLALMTLSVLWIPDLHHAAYLAIKLETLQQLYLAVGAALLGAAAIVSSLVLFAMQVNIERMPHGLFHKLSSDRKLLLAFAGTFFVAIVITALSLISEAKWAGITLFVAFWGTVLMIALFLYAYKRALVLVNPAQQLKMLVDETKSTLNKIVRQSRRAAPLVQSAVSGAYPNDKFDETRFLYFQANSWWTDSAKRSVDYAVSYTHRYAEQGDYEICETALTALVAVNVAYVSAKGRTFHSHGKLSLIDNPYVTDGFINDTLEHLRQTVRKAVLRGDEQLIELTFRAFESLTNIYLTIDYASEEATMTHAHLASGYLADAVTSVAPHNMPDVMLEGIRLLGRCAHAQFSVEGPDGIVSLVKSIGTLSVVGVARKDHNAVTQLAIEQLARLNITLLRSKTHRSHIAIAAADIRMYITMVGKLLLDQPDTRFMSFHSSSLASFFSANPEAQLQWLLPTVNAIGKADKDDQDAKAIAHNFEPWSDGMFKNVKELLLYAIEKKTLFVQELLYWLMKITEALLVVSNSAACGEHVRDKLREHSHELVAVLWSIPTDKETATFMEQVDYSDTLLKLAFELRQRGTEGISETGQMLIQHWMFDAGQHQTGWATLERNLYALACLALKSADENAVEKFKAVVQVGLQEGKLPDKALRDRTAREIRRMALDINPYGHFTLSYESCLASCDHATMTALLEDLADILSHDTAGEADPPLGYGD